MLSSSNGVCKVRVRSVPGFISYCLLSGLLNLIAHASIFARPVTSLHYFTYGAQKRRL